MQLMIPASNGCPRAHNPPAPASHVSPRRRRWAAPFALLGQIIRLSLLPFALGEPVRAAQPAPTPTSPAPEVVELSPFTVQGGDDVGYLARSSLAGTRLSQPLADTAAQVSVFTREMLEDLARQGERSVDTGDVEPRRTSGQEPG